MQVSVETTEGLERRLTITVPAAEVDSEVTKRLRQLAKNRRIDGFRPGKAPVSIIKKMYGPAVRQDVAGELMQRQYIEAVVSEKLNPAGGPSLAVEQDKEGEDLTFTATVEVYPEFEVTGLDAIEVEKPQVTIKEEDVDQMLETLRKQHATWETVDRKAAEGDRVNIDFEGKIDGEVFEGGTAEGFDLELGAGRMIPGFEDGVIGLAAGEEGTVKVTFPEDYQAENLQGKEAEFAIKVNKVEEQKLPEINEEFVKRFGIESGKAEDLRAEVQKNMTRELKQNLKNTVKEQVVTGLLEQNDVTVPSALVDQEIEQLRKQAAQRFGAQAENMPELPRELFEEQAVRRVKVGLVLGELIKSENIEAEDERVESMIQDIASAYEDANEVISYYKENKELMEQMRNLAVEDQAIDLVLSKAKVTEVEKSFQDVMQPQG